MDEDSENLSGISHRLTLTVLIVSNRNDIHPRLSLDDEVFNHFCVSAIPYQVHGIFLITLTLLRAGMQPMPEAKVMAKRSPSVGFSGSTL